MWRTLPIVRCAVRLAHERALGMGAGEPVAHRVVDGMHGLDGEDIEVLPAAVPFPLQHVQPALCHGLISPTLLLGRRRANRNRLNQALAAEADVGQPLVLFTGDHQHHVRARTRDPGGPVAHAGLARRHRETSGQKHELKETVLLETVAAAAALHQRRLQRRGLEGHRTAHLNVEVFEGNGVDVRTVQRPQRRQGRSGAAPPKLIRRR